MIFGFVSDFEFRISDLLLHFAFGSVNLGNIYLSNQFNLRNLWLKNGQSKITNYAKRTQFPKKSNIYNRNFNNELQPKIDNGHLVKTNPNKAKQTHCESTKIFSSVFSVANSERHRIREDSLKIRFVGDFDILNFAG